MEKKEAKVVEIHHKDQYCWFRYINETTHEEIKIYNTLNHGAPMTISIAKSTYLQNFAEPPLYLPGYELELGDMFFEGITKEEATIIADVRTEVVVKNFKKQRKRFSKGKQRDYHRQIVKEMIGKPIIRTFVLNKKDEELKKV